MAAERYDVAIVGGGIVGLAHACVAADRGLRVGLFERSPVAAGATVRNFGMVWPVGQPAGRFHRLAMRSRERWLRLGAAGVLEVEECGSIHAAHRADEADVLEEFCATGSHDVELLGPAEVTRRSGLVNPEGLVAGMWSPTELRVDPRTAASRLAAWLGGRPEVDVWFQTAVVRIEGRELVTARGQAFGADQTIVCSGSDLQTLYPEHFAASRLRLCKLQMLRTVSQPDPVACQPHIASGLTLRHYASFEGLASIDAVRRRVATETPELDRYGIHVMASPFPGGEIVLGDSHEYDRDISPFDKVEIDDAILRELRKVIRLQDWTIRDRWHGIYAKHPSAPIFESQAADGVRLFVGPGGAGMTLAFGLAEEAWDRWHATTPAGGPDFPHSITPTKGTA